MTHFRIPKYFHLLAVATTTLLLGACASQQLTSTWTNPEYSRGPMNKTAVIVLAKDEKIRRYAEDQMVQKLPKGTIGIAGYTLFDQPVDDKDKVQASLIKEGFDSVMVSRLVSIDKTQTYIPPQTYVQPQPYGSRPYYGSFPGYYGQAYGTVYATPGHTVEDTVVVVETLLYSLPDGKLVWTGTTSSLNPESKAELAQGLSLLIGDELEKKHLLGTPGK